MKLIFGLGNPDERYVGTRHNVGFSVLDAFAASHGTHFVQKDKFRALVGEFSSAEKILLIKPTTYYNLVGESLRALMDFYKLAPEDILVVHDELALPFGTVRTRIGGSDAGNNGVKSINLHGGTQTVRLRIGVGNEQRAIMGDTDFVLGKFTQQEAETLTSKVLPATVGIIEDFIAQRHEATTHVLND